MTQEYKNRVSALLITISLHLIFVYCIYLFKIGFVSHSENEKKSFVEIAGVLDNSTLEAMAGETGSLYDVDMPEEKILESQKVKEKNASEKINDVKKVTESKVLSKNGEYVADSTSMKKKVDDKIINAFSKKSVNNIGRQMTRSNDSNIEGDRDGLAGIGHGGLGYSLNGRSIVGGGGVPVRPNTDKPVFGKIVVGILVNGNGDVIDAWVEINGTQISDSDVRGAAIVAAKATKFNSINSSDNQRGKIIYNFKVK